MSLTSQSPTRLSRRSAARRRPIDRPAGSAVEVLERRLCLSATFTAAPGSPIAVGANPHLAAVGDFNGDGIPDLAVPNANDNTLSILLGNGSGGFTAAPGPPVPAGGGPVSVATGDFNGDAKPDVAVADFSANAVSILLGNGDGTFTAAPGSPVPAGTGPSNVTTADLDGRAGLDLVVPDFGGNAVTVLLGNGDGTFAPAPAAAAGTQPFSATAADFNGDGKRDLAVANFGGGTVTVLLGKGDGTFTPAPGSPVATGGGPYSSAAGDFNGDGKPDLAVTNFNDNTVSVLLGNGDGTFAPAPGSPLAVGANPYSVVSADFDINGRDDLAVANNGGNSLTVLLGHNDGTFTAAPDSPVAVGAGPVSLTLGDFNKDLRPDLVVSNSAAHSVSVLLNASTALPPHEPTPTPTPSPLPTGTLGAAVSASAPAQIIAGVKTRVAASVTVTAPAAAAVNGPVTVTLFLGQGLSLDNAVPLTQPATRKLKLKPGASKVLRFNLTNFPAGYTGSARLIASVKAPDGSTTAVAGPSLRLVLPSVNLQASNLSGSPASVKAGGSELVKLTLQNTGTVAAAAKVPLEVSLSTGGTGAQALATAPLSVRLEQGKSKAFRARVTIPAGTAAGSYFLVARLIVSGMNPTTLTNIDPLVSSAPIQVT